MSFIYLSSIIQEFDPHDIFFRFILLAKWKLLLGAVFSNFCFFFLLQSKINFNRAYNTSDGSQVLELNVLYSTSINIGIPLGKIKHPLFNTSFIQT